MARVKPEEPRRVDEDDFEAQTKQYAFLKKQTEYLEKQMKDLREKLFEKLEMHGETDSSGNIFIELSQEIEGYNNVIKQRRVTRKVNEDRAFEIIEELGLEDELIETKKVVNEDALVAALYSDKITEEQLEEMYPQNIVWALVLKK